MPGNEIFTWGDGRNWIERAEWSSQRTRDAALYHWMRLDVSDSGIEFGAALFDATQPRLNLVVVTPAWLHDLDMYADHVSITSGKLALLAAIGLKDGGALNLNGRAWIPGDPSWQWAANDQGAYDALVQFIGKLRRRIGGP